MGEERPLSPISASSSVCVLVLKKDSELAEFGRSTGRLGMENGIAMDSDDS